MFFFYWIFILKISSLGLTSTSLPTLLCPLQLPCVSHSYLFSLNYCSIQVTESTQHSYVHVFKADHLGLDSLQRNSTLEETVSPSVSSHLSPVTSSRGRTLRNFPSVLACQLVCHYAYHNDNHIVENSRMHFSFRVQGTLPSTRCTGSLILKIFLLPLW